MYPREALVYQYIDYRQGKQTLELTGICENALCLKLRDVNSRTTYYCMRGDLYPLTANAKRFLKYCL